jgi:glycosyltransferase involved in cell wall biosynthesis
VERAWLDRLAAEPVPLWALVRTGAGFCLLDRAGALALAAAARPAPDLLSRLTRRDPRAAAADTVVRALATARAPVPLLARMLRRCLPPGTVYLNLGHTNLTPRVLAAARAIPGGRAVVFVHDTIPLDHPEFSRPDRVAVFARRMRATAAGADRVIVNSAFTAGRVAHWFGQWGRVPPILVAPLGVTPAAPDPAALPPGFDLTAPFFLVLGTIEPRKNHALLLDVWDRLPEPRPRLVIAGSRGWAAPALFARLDAARARGDVVELAGLTDGAVAALLAHARALLFPSRAEGFGLPLAEAMAARTPVLCASLPVFHEIARDYPVYLDPDDTYSWHEEIVSRVGPPMRDTVPPAAAPPPVPSWAAHFRTVLSVV